MKSAITSLVLSILLVGAMSTRGGVITVSVPDVTTTGRVSVALFDDATAFGNPRGAANVVTAVAGPGGVLRIDHVPAGRYALMVYLDEDANGLLNRNFIGIPVEPVGFSNSYNPKGPPSFSRAAFDLADEQAYHVDVSLRRPLGERGRLGVGIGMIGRSSVYRDYDGSIHQFIPAITYLGSRVQIYGPAANVGLAGDGRMRLAATVRYRMGAYEEDESDYLAGMGDRDATAMLGLAVQAELPGAIDCSLGYEHDALGEIGGGEGSLRITRSFPLGVLRVSPGIRLNWLSSDLANHDYGVSVSEATAERPAYRADDAFSVELGIGCSVEINENWSVIVDTGVEFLDSHITESPIVEEETALKGFFAVNRIL